MARGDNAARRTFPNTVMKLPPPNFWLPTRTAISLVICGWASSIGATSPEIDSARAARYFAEAREIANKDDGKLWGRSIIGPLLFVDPVTRAVAASSPDREQHLKALDGIYVGTLPANVLIANTAVDWAGVRWTMLMWPLPEDPVRRRILLVHELWHHLQDELGFPSSGAANLHLDTPEGRTWLQLEWRALAEALSKKGAERQNASADALLFRAYRRSVFAKAEKEERAMEMHEGLAEYTGVALSGAPSPAGFVAEHNLKEAASKPTFVRSFAYASGPAYGILLDETGKDWRRQLKKTDDLGELLRTTLSIQIPKDLKQAAERRAATYGGEALAAAENERAERRAKLLATYRQKFIEGPVLAIPLEQMKMQFDPGELISLEPRGTVYPNIKIIDKWGTLTVSNGALMETDFSKVTVRAPAETKGTTVKGDGWVLELNPGWQLKTGARPADWTAARASP
jgi:hypothetical protein